MKYNKKDVNVIVKDKVELSKHMFDENGTETNDDNLACASVITIDKKTIYKLKAERNGKLFNPLNKTQFYSLASKNRTTQAPLFKFKEVNESGFRDYLNFLLTKQDSFFHLAERKTK